MSLSSCSSLLVTHKRDYRQDYSFYKVFGRELSSSPKNYWRYKMRPRLSLYVVLSHSSQARIVIYYIPKFNVTFSKKMKKFLCNPQILRFFLRRFFLRDFEPETTIPLRAIRVPTWAAKEALEIQVINERSLVRQTETGMWKEAVGRELKQEGEGEEKEKKLNFSFARSSLLIALLRALLHYIYDWTRWSRVPEKREAS